MSRQGWFSTKEKNRNTKELKRKIMLEVVKAKEVTLKVEYLGDDSILLINSNGDKFYFKNEQLEDFLLNAE